MTERTKIRELIEECRELCTQPRPEVLWLRAMYDRFRRESGISGKSEADQLLYEKMYAALPQKSSDILKIRYWRTGRHTPTNREQCLSFGRALELNPAEMQYLIQGYYDRNDKIFLSKEDFDSEIYKERKQFLNELLEEYLQKVHPSRMLQMKVAPDTIAQSIRHLYYTDAKRYISQKEASLLLHHHITSINYGSELGRNLRLEGEIPRKTMIRHLIILGAPYLNRRILDERLIKLGYLPLQEDHTLVGTERQDWLLIRFLELYQECCGGKDPEICGRWYRENARELDRELEALGMQNLRLMYFKSLHQ